MNRNQELYKRYRKHGISTLEMPEILELLLSLRLDTQSHYKFATKLKKHYKTLNEIIDEPEYELRNISGFKQDYLLGLKLPHHVADVYLYDKVKSEPIIDNSADVVKYLKHSMRGHKIEYFKVLYINSRNCLIENEDISRGSINFAIVPVRSIIKSALRYNAAGLIMAHNHPSGNPNPSREDFTLTDKIKKAAKLMEINVLDHVIVAGENHYSFADSGTL